MQIHINFEKDLKFILLTAADRFKFTLDSKQTTWNLLYKWLEYNKCQVLPRPRKVTLSKEILEHPLFNKTDNLIYKSEAGLDLSGHLSRFAETLQKEDMLLLDWDIKHFHFDDYQESTTNNRSSELVFFREHNDQLFFIQIGRHQFSDIELLEVINRNWPDQIVKMGGIIGTKHKPSSSDIHALRKSGVQSLITLSDSTVVFPLGGGYSTAKTSIILQRRVDLIRHTILNFEDGCRKEIYKLTRAYPVKPGIIKGCLSINQSGYLFFKTEIGLNLEVQGPQIFNQNQ